MMVFRYLGIMPMIVGFTGCVGPIDDGGSTSDQPDESTTSQDLVDRTDYTLVGLGGKCMDVAWGASDDGTSVNLFDCNGTTAQRWHWSGTSTNGQFIANGKCLDIPGAGIYDRNHLQLWDCNGTIAQKFDMFESSQNSLEHLDSIRVAANNGFCVEVAGGFTDNWTPIQLFDCNGTASQQWYAVSADQNPWVAPWAPSIQLVTVEVRDHRNGQDTVTYVPSVQMTDRALFETSFTWYQRQNQGGASGAWNTLGTSPASTGVGVTQTMARGYEWSTSFYEYKVVATNAAGSTESNIVSVGPPPPAAPSNVHFPSVAANSITVAWNDNSNNEFAFIVYSTCCGARTVTGTSTTFTGLAAGQTVCFQVSAYNASGDSPLSNYACATTMAPTPHTVTVGLPEYITSNGTIYYWGQPLLAGTMTKLHVPYQSPVTGVFFVKAGYPAATECANPTASHLVYAPVGTDVDLVALYGSNSVPIVNPTFATCDLYSQLTPVATTLIEVTYLY